MSEVDQPRIAAAVREILAAIGAPGFDAFETGARPHWAGLLGMAEYSEAHSAYMATVYPKAKIANTLGAWVAAERPRWRQVLSVIKQAARGIAAAHAEGLLHRIDASTGYPRRTQVVQPLFCWSQANNLADNGQ